MAHREQPQKRSGSLGYPYEPWSDSESESEEHREGYKLSSKKQVSIESTGQGTVKLTEDSADQGIVIH